MMVGNRTFRLFISSTFRDFQKERWILHESVFPEVEEYCRQRGYNFQPIDLRWGINIEAQIDQKTLELCLNEVRVSKTYPHPNFIIMVGNRYGWVPLPYVIKSDLYERIINLYKTKDDKKALKKLNRWYLPDRNYYFGSGVYGYVLRERDFIPDFLDESLWAEEEESIRKLLHFAFGEIFGKDNPTFYRMTFSATEHEVFERVLHFDKGLKFHHTEGMEPQKNYVFAFLRNCRSNGRKDLFSKFPEFYDTDQMRVSLFKSHIEKNLDRDNIFKEDVTIGNLVSEEDAEYLIRFKNFMLEKILSSIKKQIHSFSKKGRQYIEQEEHKKFKLLKSESFFGRESELVKLMGYLNTSSEKGFFLLYGRSGIGKTALVAKFISETEKEGGWKIFYRFIGVTANSTNIRTMLISLISEMRKAGVIEHGEFSLDENRFYNQIKEILKTVTRKTLVVIDALDQLDRMAALSWLPEVFPDNLKMVVSCLRQDSYKELCESLHQRACAAIEVMPMKKSVASCLIDHLLKKENRKLTDRQKRYFLHQFVQSGQSPLYLKIAFEEVKIWRSYEKDVFLQVGLDAIIEEFIDNLTEKYHHEKAVIESFFGWLYASRYGLTEIEILDLFSRDREVLGKVEGETDLTLVIRGKRVKKFPDSVWARVKEQLQPFLSVRLVDEFHLISFYHRKIQEVVGSYIYEKYSKFRHLQLAIYFETLQNDEKLWSQRYYNLHMLDETLYQWYKSDRADKMLGYIKDLEYIGAIYDAGKEENFLELLESISKISEKDEIVSIGSFYRENDYMIKKSVKSFWKPHQTLFQLAYQDGNDSFVTQDAERLLDRRRVDFPWLKRVNRKRRYTRKGIEKVFDGHRGVINGIYREEDGSILSFSKDGMILRWSLDGRNTHLFEGHEGAVNAIVPLPGKKMFSVSDDATIRLWGYNGQTLALLRGHRAAVKGAMLLEKDELLSFSEDGLICWWSMTGEHLSTMELHQSSIVGVTRLGETMLSYAEDGSMVLFNEDGEILARLSEHTDRINGIHRCADGSRWISYSNDNTLRIWTMAGECLKVLKGHTNSIRGLTEFEDGTFCSYSYDTTFRHWNLKGECLGVYRGHKWTVTGVERLKDGRFLSASGDDFLKVWDRDGKVLATWSGHTKYITKIQRLDNDRIISFSRDGTMRIWSEQGECLNVLDGHADTVDGMLIVSENRLLSYGKDGLLCLWNLDLPTKDLIEGHQGAIRGVRFMSGGKILTFSDDRTLKIWNADGRLEKTLEGHEDWVHDAWILNTETILSYSRYDRTLRIWDRSGLVKRVLKGHENWINGVVYDRERILSFDRGGCVILWNMAGKLMARFDVHKRPVLGCSFLGNGIFFSFDEQMVCIGDSRGKQCHKLDFHEEKIIAAMTLSNGRFVTCDTKNLFVIDRHAHVKRVATFRTSGLVGIEKSEKNTLWIFLKDGTLIDWDISSDRKVMAYDLQNRIAEKIIEYNGLLFVVTACGDLVCLDRRSGQMVFERVLEEIQDVFLLSDGVVSSTRSGTIKFWSFSGEMKKAFCAPVEKFHLHLVSDDRIIGSAGKELLVYDLMERKNGIV